MNSVNWAGKAASTPVLFRLSWLMPSGTNEKQDSVMIPIGSEVKTAHDVAQKLVEVWKSTYKGGPHVISMGTAVHFMTVVSKVEMSADVGTTWVTVEPNGKVYIVPGAGNEGLCCWRS